MRVVFATSEATPFCKTGGLADVSSALPRALVASGEVDVHVFLPYYRTTRRYLRDQGWSRQLTVAAFFADGRGHGHFLSLVRAGEPTWHFLDCPLYFERDGLYGAADGDFADNAARFAFFCRAIHAVAPKLCGGPPDVIHANDWQTALLPVLARTDPCATVMSIHNLAFQGNFEAAAMSEIGVDWSLFNIDALEFYNKVSLLKGGIVFADALTTVSPSYAEEILDPERGMAFDGILRVHADRLVGILNGIDTSLWNPAVDPAIARTYHPGDMRGKVACRRALAAEFGLPDDPATPIAAVISRLVFQKGSDLVAEVAPRLAEIGARLVLVGTGAAELEEQFRSLAAAHPEHVAVRIDFDEELAHRVEAGADLFLMPSRFEPCGLNQMYSMAYGTLPLAHAVGGLRDTIIDATPATLADRSATGFLFTEASADGLLECLRRAVATYREDQSSWQSMIAAGMERDFGWQRAAAAYLEVYRQALARRRE